jgi:hypothetical protein
VPSALAVVVAIGALLVSSCADAGPAASRPSASSPSTAPSASSPSSPPSPAASATSEPEIEIPDGILAAMPTQNRVDVPKGVFQVKLINRTDERFTVVGVQFVWDGYTTPVTERHDIVVGGQRIDLPVQFPGATCAGDGTLATMPDLATARARLLLDDGSERMVPVFDVDHLARKLYLEDCERQMVESLVTLEWADLHAAELDGRPVTEGVLRITRRAATGPVSVLSVSNTINFAFSAPGAPAAGPVVVLAAGEHEATAPVRFLEGRCDPHAIAESSQPFKFIAQVDFGAEGDGPGSGVHPYVVVPPVADQAPMRVRVEAGCAALDKIDFLGSAEADAGVAEQES